MTRPGGVAARVPHRHAALRRSYAAHFDVRESA
jgi:hypothetical protein